MWAMSLPLLPSLIGIFYFTGRSECNGSPFHDVGKMAAFVDGAYTAAHAAGFGHSVAKLESYYIQYRPSDSFPTPARKPAMTSNASRP